MVINKISLHFNELISKLGSTSFKRWMPTKQDEETKKLSIKKKKQACIFVPKRETPENKQRKEDLQAAYRTHK